MHRDLFLSISREQGIFSYLVGRSVGAQRIVEFGTSFGVSTVYLAAAVKDNGGGLVIGSEIVESKAVKAQRNLEEAGLADYVDIRLGDAQRTLADPGGTVDLVLMDGAKSLYLPIIKMLAPHLRPRAVVLADNVCHFRNALASYVTYMRDIRNGFQSVTVPFRGGFEYSVRLDARETFG
jgi:predicted O-methyltransferase YrrM